MNTLQIIMLAAAGYFAFKVYEHVLTLDDKEKKVEKKDTSTIEGNEEKEEVAKPLTLIDAEYLITQADEAFKNDDIDRAEELLEEAYEKDSKHLDVINKLAFINAKKGNSEKAIELYNSSIELDYSDDLVHNAIASLYKENKNYSKAKEHYELALKIDNEYAVTYYNYANLLVLTDELDRAIEYYRKAIELDSDLEEAQSELEKLESKQLD
ncbi:MAG: tetratricopeptide repeat protein [Helicobacteraceae bacterium]|nr:tetratricopeptide repeat protein [Helicobacteraceae bacterium]